MTRNGIEYDLKESPYTTNIDGVVFHFSSELYREKFEKQLAAYVKTCENAFEYRYGIRPKFTGVFEVALYAAIEKRGFYIVVKGVETNCLQKIKLSGEIATADNFHER